MKFYKILLIFLSLIILISIIFFLQSSESQACINSKCFKIEIADTPIERQTGLMYRTNLPINTGMLFIFDKPEIHSFWMKNTLIPLDIIWISEDNKIIHIEHNTQPCEAGPCEPYTIDSKAKYVLEINADLSKSYGFKEGDELHLS